MLAEELFGRGARQADVSGLLVLLERTVLAVAGGHEEFRELAGNLEGQLHLLTMLGRDQVDEVFEEATARAVSRQLGLQATPS